MPEAKVMVSARVPKELYDICIQRYNNMTIAINAGLELLRDKDCIQDENVCVLNEYSSNNHDLLKLQETRIAELQANNQERIYDLKAQIQALNEQIQAKDEQIKELNKNMNGLIFPLHNLTQDNTNLLQENSRLNTKLLPENVEIKKPWWRFW